MAVITKHTYRPVGSARTVFQSKAPEILLSGPAGTGKSRACLEKMHMAAQLNAGMRGLIVRKTAASLGSTGLVTFREKVAKEAIEAGELRFYGGSKARAPAFLYGNGSELVVGGMDRASRIMSSEYDFIYVQEATELSEDDWEALTTRLRNNVISYQQLMADSNPGPPTHWLNRRCLAGKCEMVYCRHEDNPTLFNHETGLWTEPGQVYLSKLDNLTGVRKERLRYGKWAAAEGLVYDGFNPELHTRPKPASGFPASWTRYLVVDFGFTNPFVCQWWAEDDDGRLYMYREIYFTRRLVEEHAETIREHLNKTIATDVELDDSQHAGVTREPSPTFVICDHDAEDRATLEKHLGLPTIAATKTVSDGIQAVQQRLKVQDDGRPRIQFCRDAVIERDPALDDSKKPSSTIEEFTEYIWDPGSATTSTRMGSTLRETPLKQNDHGMDCTRYMVAHLDVRRTVRLRWLGR